MSAAHGQLFRRPVWDPRQVVGTTRNALLFCWEGVWPAEGACELWLVNRPNAF